MRSMQVEEKWRELGERNVEETVRVWRRRVLHLLWRYFALINTNCRISQYFTLWPGDQLFLIVLREAVIAWKGFVRQEFVKTSIFLLTYFVKTPVGSLCLMIVEYLYFVSNVIAFTFIDSGWWMWSGWVITRGNKFVSSLRLLRAYRCFWMADELTLNTDNRKSWMIGSLRS